MQANFNIPGACGSKHAVAKLKHVEVHAVSGVAMHKQPPEPNSLHVNMLLYVVSLS